MTASCGAKPIAIMWESFGPYHHDRLRAVAEAGIPVVAIQLYGRSTVYHWEISAAPSYPVVTLARSKEEAPTWRQVLQLVRAVRESGAGDCYFCHYDYARVFLASTWLRLRGHRVFTMLASKYDDYPRKAWREKAKRVLMRPYAGAIVAGRRSRDYIAGLGVDRARTVIGYDTLDIARMATQGQPSAGSPAFADRPFLIVARLEPKKNVSNSLHAFARYAREQQDGRRLKIIGEGPLRAPLEALASELGVAGLVDFEGLQESARVSEAMRGSLALLLPSISEQFGLVVNEAFANSLPTIISSQCGAVDVLLDDGENGIVIDARSIDQLHAAMTRIGTDEALWRRMSAAALASAPRGDVRRFVEAVRTLSGIAAAPSIVPDPVCRRSAA
jgi:glycosyltransferase involved in cell wall biosynthesis